MGFEPTTTWNVRDDLASLFFVMCLIFHLIIISFFFSLSPASSHHPNPPHTLNPDPAQPPLSQMYLQEGVTSQIQETCDNIDLWAMWISPPVFIIFNLAYWLTYQHTEVEPANGY